MDFHEIVKESIDFNYLVNISYEIRVLQAELVSLDDEICNLNTLIDEYNEIYNDECNEAQSMNEDIFWSEAKENADRIQTQVDEKYERLDTVYEKITEKKSLYIDYLTKANKVILDSLQEINLKITNSNNPDEINEFKKLKKQAESYSNTFDILIKTRQPM